MPAKDAKPHTKPKRRWLWGPIIFVVTWAVSGVAIDIVITLLGGDTSPPPNQGAQYGLPGIGGIVTAILFTLYWATNKKGQKEVLSHCVVCGEEIHPKAPSQEVHAGVCNRTYLEKGQRSLEKVQRS
jgi:hypothetical protein